MTRSLPAIDIRRRGSLATNATAEWFEHPAVATGAGPEEDAAIAQAGRAICQRSGLPAG